MPSFENPVADAGELSEAARGLAHATRHFDEPGDSYAVLGELQSALISLHQSLQQLVAFHTRLADRASTDAGDRADGREHALTAAMRLDTAAVHVDRATDHLMVGFAENGQIAWLPAPSPAEKALAERAEHLEITSSDRPDPPSSAPAPGR
ncbi:hypothetical protein [Glutamicibacter sp. BSL13]|jgi:hypothetical protein